jgi:propanol-preferring alcohol dehydrogenase
VIIGAGGLGLMGVQIAHAITSAKIICVDLDDKKLETAKEMGADFVKRYRNVSKNYFNM